jgi:regulator of sigma E protease
LIFFHELGHFIIAKLFNVKVLTFSLGFGLKLVGKKIGETEYVISAFPLGGYVKMLGEDEDEEVDSEDSHRSFSAQPPVKRIAIAAAGPLFNLFLAFFLFVGIYIFSGYPVITAEVGQVRAGAPADKASIQKGDIIEYIDGKKINQWDDIKKLIQDSPGRSLDMTIIRGDERLSKTIVPEEEAVKNVFGEEVKSALIGIVSSGNIKTLNLGPLQAIAAAGKKTWEIIALTVLVVVKLFQGVIPLKTVGGPIMIGQLAGDIARESVGYLFPFMAVISINLAILNLLPVPILDGGLILFLLIEIVIRKPISLRKKEMAQKVGFFLLLLLMAIVFYNDLARLISN